MRTIIQWTALLGTAALAFACGSGSSGGGFPNGEQGDDSGDTASSSSGAGTGSGSSSGNGSSSSTFSTSGAGGMGNGTCKTGNYAGTFVCEFFLGDANLADASSDAGLISVKGTMSFALMQNMSAGVGEGTGTDTAMGTFLAATGGFIAASADLSGTLNCSAGAFTGALTNGDYGLDFGGMPVSGPGNTFQGPFDSMYDGTTATFVDGTWSMSIAGEGTCAGSWTAAYTGPLDGGTSTGIVDAGGQ
jgi:hypothetical protein